MDLASMSVGSKTGRGVGGVVVVKLLSFFHYFHVKVVFRCKVCILYASPRKTRSSTTWNFHRVRPAPRFPEISPDTRDSDRRVRPPPIRQSLESRPSIAHTRNGCILHPHYPISSLHFSRRLPLFRSPLPLPTTTINKKRRNGLHDCRSPPGESRRREEACVSFWIPPLVLWVGAHTVDLQGQVEGSVRGVQEG